MTTPAENEKPPYLEVNPAVHVPVWSFVDPSFTGGLEESQVAESLSQLKERLAKIQEDLYIAHSNSVLVIFQGVEGAGKDAVVSSVVQNLHPNSCRVKYFVEPTKQESRYNFLWRAHKSVPSVGNIGVFVRSYYDDVVDGHLQTKLSDQTINQRLENINNFERLLVDNKTIIIKIFLHISQESQRKKLEQRGNYKLAWRFGPNDWLRHMDFHKVLSMYSNVFHYTSTSHSPWHIIPADNPWFAQYGALKLLADILGKIHENKWKREIQDMLTKQKNSPPPVIPPPTVYSLTNTGNKFPLAPHPSSQKGHNEEGQKKAKL